MTPSPSRTRLGVCFRARRDSEPPPGPGESGSGSAAGESASHTGTGTKAGSASHGDTESVVALPVASTQAGTQAAFVTASVTVCATGTGSAAVTARCVSPPLVLVVLVQLECLKKLPEPRRRRSEPALYDSWRPYIYVALLLRVATTITP